MTACYQSQMNDVMAGCVYRFVIKTGFDTHCVKNQAKLHSDLRLTVPAGKAEHSDGTIEIIGSSRWRKRLLGLMGSREFPSTVPAMAS